MRRAAVEVVWREWIGRRGRRVWGRSGGASPGGRLGRSGSLTQATQRGWLVEEGGTRKERDDMEAAWGGLAAHSAPHLSKATCRMSWRSQAKVGDATSSAWVV